MSNKNAEYQRIEGKFFELFPGTKSTTTAPVIPGDKEIVQKQQYWPDRSQHYAGW